MSQFCCDIQLTLQQGALPLGTLQAVTVNRFHSDMLTGVNIVGKKDVGRGTTAEPLCCDVVVSKLAFNNPTIQATLRTLPRSQGARHSHSATPEKNACLLRPGDHHVAREPASQPASHWQQPAAAGGLLDCWTACPHSGSDSISLSTGFNCTWLGSY